MSAAPGPSDAARQWHDLIGASVRECVQTWRIQAKAGPVTVEALEAILARATVPLLRRLDGQPPEVVVALLPILLRTMLAACLEIIAEREQKR